MPIPLDKPIAVAAQPARTADKLWLSSLNIMAPSPAAKVRVTAVLTPMVSETGDLLRGKSKNLVLDDVIGKAQADPQLAATMEAIFAEVYRQAKLANLFA